MNEWHCDPTQDQAIDTILSIYFPICKLGTWRRYVRPLGYRLVVISPRPSSTSCKQGALGYSFNLLSVEVAFDLLRVK